MIISSSDGSTAVVACAEYDRANREMIRNNDLSTMCCGTRCIRVPPTEDGSCRSSTSQARTLLGDLTRVPTRSEWLYFFGYTGANLPTSHLVTDSYCLIYDLRFGTNEG